MVPRPKSVKRSAAEIFSALGQAERVAILKCFEPSDGDAKAIELSAKMLSQRLAKPMSNIAYHVKALRSAGLLYTARYEQRRGARENYQKLTALGERAMDLIEHAENVAAG